MNQNKLNYITLLALVAGVSGYTQAEEDKVFELDDFVVVGQYLQADQINALKTPTPIEDIPQSLSILTSDLISLQDLTSMGGIADYVPGIIAGQGEGHRDDILFRGQKSTADFYVDGVRDDVQYYRPLYNVEQIEVIKGANALFFGRGGTGGLINRVSKTPQLGEGFTAYTFSLDALGERSLQVDTNIGITPNAALRLNYYTEDLENHREFYYGDNSGINPTLKVTLNDRTRVNVFYENLDHERFIDRGITADANGDPVESLIHTTFADKDINKSTLDANTFKVSVDHEFNTKTKLRLSYIKNDFDKLYQNYYANGAVSGTGENATVQMSGYKDTTQRESSIFSADLIGEKEINGINHKYVLGVESIDTANNNDRIKSAGQTLAISQLDTLASLAPFSASNGGDLTKANLEVTSLYFSDEIALSEELDLIIGGRFDDFELSVHTYDVVTKALDATSPVSKKEEVFSPRLGLVYKPQNKLTFYASYSESFIPKSGEQFANLSGDEKQKTDPDVYENLEIGTKFSLENGLSLTAALYNLTAVEATYKEDQVDEITENEYRGLELQASGNILDNWFISAGASFVSDANILNEVPAKTYSLWNLYKLDNRLSLGLGVIHKGDTSGKGNVNLPSYTRVDAAAYYKINNNMRIQLNIENIADTLYFPNSYGDHQVTVGAPLNATLKIVGHF